MKPMDMRAMVIDAFGEPFRLRSIAVPDVGSTEVLIRLAWAGVGSWDPVERDGLYADAVEGGPSFPYVLGSQGSGTVAEVGPEVERLRPGDLVYAASFLNPKGGFYAEYAVVDADLVAVVPPGFELRGAGCGCGAALTGLRGLDDTLAVGRGDSLAVVGAGGAIGHTAIQLATRMGAEVLAVASGSDGVALAESLGAQRAVDGRAVGEVAEALTAFAPAGPDAALVLAGGDAAQAVVDAVRGGGRVAYPTGVQPEPHATPAVEPVSFNGLPDGDLLRRFDALISAAPITVHVAAAFDLEQAADAHRALADHHLGTIGLRIR